MRKLFAALVFTLAFAPFARGQSTAVTGTATDSQATPYIGGTWTATLKNTSTSAPIWQGSTSFRTEYGGSLDSTGSLAVTLPSNTGTGAITVGGLKTTQWQFNICARDGGTCFVTAVTISGTSQSISASLVNSSRITFTDGEPNQPPCASNQVIVSLGSTSWGCVATTAINVPGGVNTQVQFNDAGVFNGDAGMTFNKATDALTVGSIYTSGGRPWFDIRAYGATGDGVTDDTAAINATIAAMPASPKCGQMLIPAGTYIVSTTIAFSNRQGCRIIGSGHGQTTNLSTSALKWTGAANGTVISFTDCVSCYVNGFMIDGNSIAGKGLEYTSATGSSQTSLFEDLGIINITGTPGDALYVGSSTGRQVDTSTFRNITTNNSVNGVFQEGTNTLAILYEKLEINQVTNSFIDLETGGLSTQGNTYLGPFSTTGVNLIQIANTASYAFFHDDYFEGGATGDTLFNMPGTLNADGPRVTIQNGSYSDAITGNVWINYTQNGWLSLLGNRWSGTAGLTFTFAPLGTSGNGRWGRLSFMGNWYNNSPVFTFTQPYALASLDYTVYPGATSTQRTGSIQQLTQQEYHNIQGGNGWFSLGSGDLNNNAGSFLPDSAAGMSLWNNGLDIAGKEQGTCGFTNVASGAFICAKGGAVHEVVAATNGSNSSGVMNRSMPSPINSADLTAAVTTATLCTGTGSCDQPGQYMVRFDFIETGTACATPGTGGVTFLLTWTDANGTAHTAVSLGMDDASALNVVSQTFHFQTSLGAAFASGQFVLSSNGTTIQYATGYTACSVGTGTYRVQASVARLQ